jgi:hypothetical protein
MPRLPDPARVRSWTTPLLALFALAACTGRDREAGPIVAEPGPLARAVRAVSGRPSEAWLDGDSTRRIRVVPTTEVDAVDAARLCGYLAARPTTPFRVPGPAAQEVGRPVRALAYPTGALRGVRYVLDGAPAHYHFVGLTADGLRRITVSLPLPPASAAEPSLAAYDALATSVRWQGPPTPPNAPTARPALPDSLAEPDRAVPDLRESPDEPLTLDAACPVVTIGAMGLARLERIYRIAVPANHWLHFRARAAVGGVTIAFDRPAVPDSARTLVGPWREDSVRIDAARIVAARVTYVQRIRVDPNDSFLTLSFALRPADAP